MITLVIQEKFFFKFLIQELDGKKKDGRMEGGEGGRRIGKKDRRKERTSITK